MKTGTQKRRTIMTIALFAVAGVLIVAGAIGAVRAALVYSETYETELDTQSIGIALHENGETDVSEGTLLADFDGKIVPGMPAAEELTVKNTGTIDEYVRLVVYRYWKGENGKDLTLDPELIELTVGDGWKLDEKASTKERVILYYTDPLKPGDETPPAITSVGVSYKLQTIVTQEKETVEGLTTITTTYDYDGTQIGLEVEADGVQTHNAEDAILSAWGVQVSVGANGKLTIK